MKETNVLEISKLSKSYNGKSYALSNCSFVLPQGKICAVVGESGSGKSTLLRLIAGLERPTRGKIAINGRMVSDDNKIVNPRHRNVGMVFQDFALFPHMTVAQNISFGLKTNSRQTVDRLLDLIQMKEYASAYPHQLSGGQEQRVALARTLALYPDLLLLDEPFSNLDASLKSELRKEIRNIVKDIGISMIFITHDIYDALDIADEIIFLKGEKVLIQIDVENIAKKELPTEVLQVLCDLKSKSERIVNILDKGKTN